MESIQLTNFNVPITTRRRFDAICHASGRTRTSVLVELMNAYILEQADRLAEQNRQLASADRMLAIYSDLRGDVFETRQIRANRNVALKSPVNSEFEAFDILYSDGRGEH